MRSFKLENPIDSVLITGRSISYLLKNKDLNLAFKSIHKNLNKDGIVCFDFIDANRFIPEIVTNPNVIHGAHFKGNKYVRESKWSLHLEYGMDLKWEVNYFKEIAAKKHQIAEDVEIIRCFTKNEIVLFLTINNFEIVEILDRKTYAFPTYVIVAKKI